MRLRPRLPEVFPDFHDANTARERWLDSLDASERARVSFRAKDKARIYAIITPREDGAYVLTIK